MIPDRHRMALLTWLVVYPLITVLIALLEPLLGALPLPLRTLVLTGIMVPAMVYVAMPFAMARFAAWLRSGALAGTGEREGGRDA